MKRQLDEFKLERFFAQHEFAVEHLLCASDCQTVPIGELLDFELDAEARFRQLTLGYTESSGSPRLREEIAKLYSDIDPDHVVVLSGAQEGILLFGQACLSDGDHAIVHWPCYQSLHDVPNIRCEVDRWEARFESGWCLDIDDLRSLLRPNTKAIVINTPHNPTGWLMPREQFDELHALAADLGITVFCDEVYRESEHDPLDRLPAGCDSSPLGVSLGVMSKSYGLAGLRIGWLATKNRALLDRIKQLKDYTTICNSGPSEFLAELALRHREQLLAKTRTIARDNLRLLDEFISGNELISWVKPHAGAICFPQLDARYSIDGLAAELIAEAGVLIAPGTMFDHHANHFRLGFGRANFADGLSALQQFFTTSEKYCCG